MVTDSDLFDPENVDSPTGTTVAETSSLVHQRLKGEVKRVVFENPETGYTVLRLSDAQGVEQTAVGRFQGIFEGQSIELFGKWETHPDHGRQFRTESYTLTLPTTAEGIRRYLASGVVPGIGPKTADAIVERFEDRTLEILDHQSVRLLEVPGFGRKRLKMVREAWREQAERRNIDIFLQGLGISPAYCNRIYRAYGNQAADIVRTNPFRLAKEIDGIGFLSADRIAGSLSIGKMDIRRIEAGILHGFDKLAQEGHTGYPETDFLEITARLLDVSEEDVKTALGNAIRNGNAVEETWNLDGIPTPMVFERDMWNQEQELASLIRNLSGPRQARTKNPATARQSDTTVELNEQQKNAVQMARANRVSVITGGPGVGKTTVVGEIVRKAQAAGLKILLAAPTGRAAKRMAESCRRPAATIHRLLKWDPAEKKFVFNSRRRLSAHLLIVDETSMLDISLAVSLFRAIAPVTTVVLVGDPDQLPSVGPGNVLHDLIRSGLCPVTHLSVVYRQSRGSRIIDNAHRVNNGVMPEFPAEEDRKTLHDCYWIEQDTPEEAVQTIVRLVRERIPKRFGFNPLSDIQVLCPMNRGSCGTAALNQLLQLELNPGKGPRIMLGERSFHPGDRVMQIRNNYEKLVFNGDLGRIGKIDTKAQTFQVDFEDRAVQYEFSETDQLTLAYAVTVHKSQGSEYPAVVVPLLTQHFLMLRRNLLYTAMTRAKRLLVFVGSQKALGIAVRNNHVEPRCTMLRRRLRGDQPISRDS